jgi:hypothetical protein
MILLICIYSYYSRPLPGQGEVLYLRLPGVGDGELEEADGGHGGNIEMAETLQG